MSTIRRYAAATTTALLLAGSIAACSTGDDTVDPDGSTPPDSNVAPPEQNEPDAPEGEAPEEEAPEDEAPAETDPGEAQPPAEGEEPPVAEEPPAEGEEPPAEGEEPPAEGEEPPAESGAGLAEAGWVAFELPADAQADRDDEGYWTWAMPATEATDPHASEQLVVQGPQNHAMDDSFEEEIADFEATMSEDLPPRISWDDAEVAAPEGMRIYRFETIGLEPGEVHWIVENSATGELMQLTVTVNGDSTEMVDAIDSSLQLAAG
ncbi:hypothetical protein ACPYO6_15635 [Georgenia sp. Z1344]|uniref:hypothetical protein n=1 Tax=Georgenia sp. Z1344 TaxID=3416706 RepID=UPI003CEF4577